jgi:hypothetical protein
MERTHDPFVRLYSRIYLEGASVRVADITAEIKTQHFANYLRNVIDGTILAFAGRN